MKYFEDVEIGAKAVLGQHTFTLEEILAFARDFDPQPFHLDEEAAKRSRYGALIASGWHTTAVWMKCLLAHRAEVLKAGGEATASGPSPGFTNLHWLKPVYAGDTITYAMEVKEKTESRSKPKWGIVRAYNTGTNQHGEVVIDFESAVFVARRGG